MREHVALTMGDLLEDNAKRFGDEPAYIMGDEKLTHQQLLSRAKQLAAALEEQGLQSQDRIGILAMNCLEYGEVLAAGQWSGLVVATVNFRLAAPEMAHIINDSSPRILFFEAQYEELIEQLRPQLVSVESFVCIDSRSGGLNKTELIDVIDYQEFLHSGSPQGSSYRSREEDIACLIYTSGTTGKPKGCILGQREMREGARTMSVETRSGPDDRILLVMPLFHIGAMAMGQGIHFRGGGVVLHREFNPLTLLQAVQNDGVSILHLAPTLVQMVLEQDEVANTDFSQLHTVVYSAAAMPLPVLKRGMQLLGNIFLNLYGQTEVFSSGLLREQHHPNGTERQKRWLTSVGQPFPNTLIRIVDDQGQDCSQGNAGEIVVKSAAMARGYWNNGAATLETFRDGWCHSGDVGIFDEDGMLYLVDRKKDVIVSGGENIYSREVEDAIMAHSSVLECAVIGVPDDKWGEAVCAVVVLRDGESASKDDLITHCRSLIAGYKKPRKIVFDVDIPKLPTGKLDKVTLRKSVNG